MIAHLCGEVIDKAPQNIILNVQGVGYSISVVDERLYVLNQIVTVHVYYHWNQENGPALYGFPDALSKLVFAQIVSCSGCGPKIGLAVLAHMSATEFLRAITLSNASALSAVSGIGPKKAELMIMQLKDKVAKVVPPTGMPGSEHESLTKIKHVQEALATLRYKPAEITAALEFLNTQGDFNTIPLDELLRKSLSFLAKRV